MEKQNVQSLSCATIIDLKWVCHSVMAYHYALFPPTLKNIPSKEQHKKRHC